jgi:predicted heme/steroid binding protein
MVFHGGKRFCCLYLKVMVRNLSGPLLVLPFIIFTTLPFRKAHATEEYARQTHQECIACHEKKEGGGKLNLEGQLFLNRILREEAERQPQGLYQPWLQIGIGFIHIIGSVFWIGSLLYIILLAKTPYAYQGPAKNEVRFGVATILIVALTGLYLMLHRKEELDDFAGILFHIKIWFFAGMVFLTFILYQFIIPRLRKKAAPASNRMVGRAITRQDLRMFDGRFKRPTYVGYLGKIYDVSESRYWSNGQHFFRHYSGQDLTRQLQDAPHNEPNILRMPLAGQIMEKQQIYAHWRITLTFYAAIFLNIILGAGILVLIAISRWWE